jgi:hypothetical protein
MDKKFYSEHWIIIVFTIYQGGYVWNDLSYGWSWPFKIIDCRTCVPFHTWYIIYLHCWLIKYIVLHHMGNGVHLNVACAHHFRRKKYAINCCATNDCQQSIANTCAFSKRLISSLDRLVNFNSGCLTITVKYFNIVLLEEK